jgi:NAD(P)H dehydrogenase (quinone)
MAKQIVVTGSSGTIGQRVVEGLRAKQVPVVEFHRGAGGSFEDAASLDRAFAGADTVVLITPANAHAVEQTVAAIDAAKRNGVRKIVRISALKAGVDGPTDNTRQHGRTEAALKASGLTYVILRPHLFLQNLRWSMGPIQAEGKLYGGNGDGKMGMVDTRDVADAAVIAATSDAFDGGTYELTGPASIDYHQVAAAIGRGLGRTVTYVPVPSDAFAEAARGNGADDWMVGILRDYSAAYARGWGDFTTDNVQRITGHAPRSVDDFVKDVLARND